jgi:hypothetical protein
LAAGAQEAKAAYRTLTFVMAGLVPAIHVLLVR